MIPCQAVFEIFEGLISCRKNERTNEHDRRLSHKADGNALQAFRPKIEPFMQKKSSNEGSYNQCWGKLMKRNTKEAYCNTAADQDGLMSVCDFCSLSMLSMRTFGNPTRKVHKF